MIRFERTNKLMIKYLRNSFGPNKRCILMTGAIGLLIGLIVCGVPLAVMTTLYLQQSTLHFGYTISFFVLDRIDNINECQ